MKVRILESAREDLREGYRFYEQQQEGIGDYFLDMLSAEIDSLALYGGIHAMRSATIGCCRPDSRSPSITGSNAASWWCGQCSTAGVTLPGSGNG